MTVEEYLQKQQITYTLHEHPAVYTCEEAEEHCADIPGLACKNLLVKNKKKTRYFLVVVPAKKRVDMKKLGEELEEKRLSFASADQLWDKLKLEPGSVSPFGVLNDTENSVELCLDKEVAEAEIVSFHPNKNTATLELAQKEFQKFLESIPQKVVVVDL